MGSQRDTGDAHLTDNVKSPGLLLLGLARKLPSTPRVSSRFSASTPVMFGWNHLKKHHTSESLLNLNLHSNLLHGRGGALLSQTSFTKAPNLATAVFFFVVFQSETYAQDKV